MIKNNDIDYSKRKFRIVIAMNTMLCGGIEKSLLSLLNSLDKSVTDVTLLLDEKSGAFLDFVPNWVRIVEIPYDDLTRREKQIGRKKLLLKLCKTGNILSALRLYYIQKKEMSFRGDELRIKRAERFYSHVRNCIELEQQYDLAISYANLEQHILVSKYIRASKKIAFFHTQLDTQREDITYYESYLNNFDKLYGVSRDLVKSLKLYLPSLKDRIVYYPHILNKDMMLEWSVEYKAVWPSTGIRILSVGRLAKQKGFDLIPEIAAKLQKDNVQFQWLIIGEGAFKTTIENAIAKYDMNNFVFIENAKPNPYPFFASCDIYVQPSRYEGYCLTLAEARAFTKPIVSTIFDGATEQLENGKCGKIVKCDVDSLYSAIKKLIVDSQSRNNFVRELSYQTISNFDGVNMIMNELYD